MILSKRLETIKSMCPKGTIADIGADHGKLIISLVEDGIQPKDIINRNLDVLLNPENVITTVKRTHDAIHYGDETLLALEPADRKPNDMIPWR